MLKNKLKLAATLVATTALAGCGDAPKTVEVMATETATHTVTSSPTAPVSTPSSAVAETSRAQNDAQFTPGDPGLVLVDGIGLTGMFLNPDTGEYYVCNGGELAASQGAPVESGTCAGPFTDYYEAGELTSRLSEAVGGAMEQEAIDQGLIDPVAPVDEGDITARFWECMEAGGTEETCRQ